MTTSEQPEGLYERLDGETIAFIESEKRRFHMDGRHVMATVARNVLTDAIRTIDRYAQSLPEGEGSESSRCQTPETAHPSGNSSVPMDDFVRDLVLAFGGFMSEARLGKVREVVGRAVAFGAQAANERFEASKPLTRAQVRRAVDRGFEIALSDAKFHNKLSRHELTNALMHELGLSDGAGATSDSHLHDSPAEVTRPSGSSEIPRRIDMRRWTPAEKAIDAAVQAVEAAGCDVRLTDAVLLLAGARDSVADFVDDCDRRRVVGERCAHHPDAPHESACLRCMDNKPDIQPTGARDPGELGAKIIAEIHERLLGPGGALDGPPSEDCPVLPESQDAIDRLIHGVRRKWYELYWSDQP